MHDKKALNSSNNEQLKVAGKFKTVLSSPYGWLCKTMYWIAEQQKPLPSLWNILRNEVSSQTRICLQYTLCSWFRHEESGDSGWKCFLFPTWNNLCTHIHFLAWLSVQFSTQYRQHGLRFCGPALRLQEDESEPCGLWIGSSWCGRWDMQNRQRGCLQEARA